MNTLMRYLNNRIQILFCFALLFSIKVVAQNSNQYLTATTAGGAIAASWLNQQSGGIGYHILSWTGSGTRTTCSVELDYSVNGSTSAGTVITTQDCTTNGQSIIEAGVYNYVRVNVTAITGASNTVNIVYSGYVVNPISVPNTCNANTVFAGPTSGSAAALVCRVLVSADIPNNAANTSGQAATVAGGPYPASTNGVDVTSGNVGSVVESNIPWSIGSPPSLTSGQAVSITSITLPAGNWDVTLKCYFTAASTTTFASLRCGANTSTNTMPSLDADAAIYQYWGNSVVGAGDPTSLTSLPARFNFTTSTTLYMVEQGNFSVSTMTGGGTIRAERVP